jgi:hypothetical protein
MVETIYKLAYQITPMWLTGGTLEDAVPGGMLPFAVLTDPDLYRAAVGSLVNPSDQSAARNLDHAFGTFTIMPQGTAIRQTVAEYPFANQHVAANATIFQPLQVSLLWDTPMKTPDAWTKKFTTMTNLVARLTYHCNNGGTYAVVTPSFIYTDLILTNMADIARAASPLPQNAWRFDFEKPMIRISDLIAAQSALMAKLTKGLQTDGSWTGTQVGLNLGVALTQMMERSPTLIPAALIPPGVPH